MNNLFRGRESNQVNDCIYINAHDTLPMEQDGLKAPGTKACKFVSRLRSRHAEGSQRLVAMLSLDIAGST
jgi:hypothetical protein